MAVTVGELKRSYLAVVRAVVLRELALRRRYPLTEVRLFGAYLVLVVLFVFGWRAVSGQGSHSASIVVGALLWMMVTAVCIEITNAIETEAKWGTLERHLITPFGFGVVLLTKFVLTTLVTGALSLLLLSLIVLTGEPLGLDVLTLVALVGFSLLGAFGVGLAAGGLTVYYDRTDQLTPLLSLWLAGLVWAPVTGVGWVRLLPLTQGSAMILESTRAGTRLWEFGLTSIVALVVTTLLYCYLGYIIFQACQLRARKQAVIGDF